MSALQVVLPPVSSNSKTAVKVVVSGGSEGGTFFIIPVGDNLSAQSFLNSAATAFGSNLVTAGGGSSTVSLIAIGD